MCLLLARGVELRMVPDLREPSRRLIAGTIGDAMQDRDIGSERVARELPQGLDLAADFSVPGGTQAQIRSQVGSMVESAEW